MDTIVQDFKLKEGVCIHEIMLTDGKIVNINSIDCGIYSYVVYNPLGGNKYAKHTHLFYCYETDIYGIMNAANKSITRFYKSKLETQQ